MTRSEELSKIVTLKAQAITILLQANAPKQSVNHAIHQFLIATGNANRNQPLSTTGGKRP